MNRDLRVQQIIEKLKAQPGVENVILADKKGFPIRSTFPQEMSESATALLISVFGQLEKFGESLGLNQIHSLNLNTGSKGVAIVSAGPLYMIAIKKH